MVTCTDLSLFSQGNPLVKPSWGPRARTRKARTTSFRNFNHVMIAGIRSAVCATS